MFDRSADLSKQAVPKEGFIRILAWPIVIFLAIVSVPPGALPFIAWDAYRSMQASSKAKLHEIGGYMAAQREKSLAAELPILLWMLAVSLIVHLTISTAFAIYRKQIILGLRGTVWVILMWTATATGIAIGLIMHSIEPPNR